MANFKELVAAFEGREKPRLADSSSYKPEIDVIIKFLGSQGALQANIDGSHRREARRMVKENYPEIYKANKGIHFTSDKMYIGLSPEVCRYMSMKLNEAGHTVVGDTSMHKLMDVGFGPYAPWLDEPSLAKQSDSADLPVGLMYLVVGLLIQGEHNVTPSLYELVDDVKHAGDKDPMAVTHTNAEWLAMIETWRNWGKYLSDHIIEWDVEDEVSDQQAAARLDAITKFRAKVDDLGPTSFPRKFHDLFKERIAATNTNIRSEAYRIKNQMPDLVISFFTEFALLACAPELIAVSAPNVSNALWISMKAEGLPVMPKGEEVDKDDKVWLNTELCKTCIVEGDFKAPATKQAVADAMSAVRARKATVFIADALFGAGSHTWDSKDAAWGTADFNDAAAAFSVWWDHMHPSYSFTHRNLKTILIDNQKTQIAGMKSGMTSWFKKKPWDETQRLRPDDFEKWPGLPLPMTEGEERAERAAAEKRTQEAAERRGDYVIEDDDM
eukprot:jgi/Tetstr1/455761/TSEL_042559.t3